MPKRKRGEDEPSKRDSYLRKNLLSFLYTHPDWPGSGEEDSEVFIKSTQFKAKRRERDLIQDCGGKYGCHTCCTFINVDANQPWTGDHIPSTGLKPHTIEALVPVHQTLTHRMDSSGYSYEISNLPIPVLPSRPEGRSENRPALQRRFLRF